MGAKPAFVVALFVASAVAGCSDAPPPEAVVPTTVPTPKAALAHSNFGSCAELRRYYARTLTANLLRPGGNCWGCPKASAAKSLEAQEPGDHSAFMVQTDLDSGHFYLLRSQGGSTDLVTVKAVPAETMAITSRLDIGGRLEFRGGLYLDAAGGRLVLIKPRLDPPALAGYPRPNINTSLFSVEVLFYDVSDPAVPQLTGRFQIAGSLLGSRRVGPRVHLAIHTAAEFPTSLGDSPAFYELLADYQAALERNDRVAERLGISIRSKVENAVRRAPIEELVPVWRQGFGAAYEPLDCTLISRPQLDVTLGFVTVTSINLDGGDLGLTAAVTESWDMHANDENLYLLQSSNYWWWDPAQTQQSVIYRYRLGDAGAAQLTGYGLVNGLARNYHGVSEHEGYLRVATSEGRYDAEEERWGGINHLFVLGPAGGDPLSVVGHVEGFEPGLSVSSSRFDGDRAFVIMSGRPPPRTSPMLAFDLSDPAEPRIAGSLGVPFVLPGLHLAGEDRLVGFGQEVTSEGFWMHLLTFDVADLAMPQQLDDLKLGDDDEFSVSHAGNQPQGFNLKGDHVVVPLRTREEGPGRSGFAVHRLTDLGGMEPIGWVDHGSSDAFRSVLIEEPAGRTVLYTLSDAFLKADAVGDTLTPIQTLPLAE